MDLLPLGFPLQPTKRRLPTPKRRATCSGFQMPKAEGRTHRWGPAVRLRYEARREGNGSPGSSLIFLLGISRAFWNPEGGDKNTATSWMVWGYQTNPEAEMFWRLRGVASPSRELPARVPYVCPFGGFKAVPCPGRVMLEGEVFRTVLCALLRNGFSAL